MVPDTFFRGHLRGVVLNRHGLLRVPWRVGIFLPALLAVFLVVTLTMTVIYPLLGFPEDTSWREGRSVPVLVLLYTLFTLSVLAASVLAARLLDRRPAASIGLGFHSRWPKELLIGLLLGAVFVSAVVAVQLAARTLRLEASGVAGGDLAREFAFYVLFFTGVAFFEELLFRGYLLQVLAEGIGDFAEYLGTVRPAVSISPESAERIGKVVAAVLLSAPFGFVHYFNTGGTFIGAMAAGMAGLVLSLAYFRTRSLWVPVGMHTTWNFFLAWVFSLPVSGEVLPRTPFTATVSGPDWLSGGSFGPEGSILTFVALSLMVVILARWRQVEASPEAAAWYPPQRARSRQSRAVPSGDPPV
jgi:membrane protease YdiL (CAAX protease family)